MIEFHLDARSGVSAYLQLVQQVKRALRLGLLDELKGLVQDVALGVQYVCEIGCVIATHSGPGCIGFAYVPK